MEAPYISVVIPIMNEFDNVDPLYEQVSSAIDDWGRSAEFVLVDDGSTDGTRDKLQTLSNRDPRVKLVLLRRNFGQTAAMQAGIDFAQGEIIVTMDGDLQNDPRDIPVMVEKLEEGYDLIHGWRKDRQDKLVSRKIPSKIANRLISKVTGFPIHDLGCTLKAIRSEVAKELELYGEMHRFIPILAHMNGAKCHEIVTRHRARIHGETKYGIGRTTRVVLDLLTVKYLLKYFASPMKLFGQVGLVCSTLAILCVVGTVGMKLIGGVDMTGNPMTLMAGAAGLAAIQFFSLGLLGEVNARIYFAQQGQRNYKVRRLVNFEPTVRASSTPVRRAA